MVGLTPVKRLRSVADAFVANEFGSSSFGCIHARIERDMQLYWRQNGGGVPPTLLQFLQQAISVPALAATRAVFISVGKNIPSAEDERLLRSGRFGTWRLARVTGDEEAVRAPGAVHASFMRLVEERTHSRKGQPRRLVATPGYLDAALVDAAICRRASWFAGWSGSSFARALAGWHWLDAGRPYWSVCNASIERVEDGRLRANRCS